MSPIRLASRNPFESVVLAGAVFSLPAALGVVPPPPAVVAQVGDAAQWWLAALVACASIALIGLILESPRRSVVSVNGLIFEQIGVFAFGWVCVFYAISAAVLHEGWPALLGSGWILGFGAAGFWQALKIENYLRRLRGKPQLRFPRRRRPH